MMEREQVIKLLRNGFEIGRIGVNSITNAFDGDEYSFARQVHNDMTTASLWSRFAGLVG